MIQGTHTVRSRRQSEISIVSRTIIGIEVFDNPICTSFVSLLYLASYQCSFSRGRVIIEHGKYRAYCRYRPERRILTRHLFSIIYWQSKNVFKKLTEQSVTIKENMPALLIITDFLLKLKDYIFKVKNNTTTLRIQNYITEKKSCIWE